MQRELDIIASLALEVGCGWMEGRIWPLPFGGMSRAECIDPIFKIDGKHRTALLLKYDASISV